MTILPVAAFVLMLLILKKKGIGGRRGFLAATTFWGTSVVLITELLSVPRLVTRGGVAIAWLAICVVCLIVYSKLEPGAIALPSEQRSSSDVADADSADNAVDRATTILLRAAALIVALVGITALIAPPGTIDGMTYHMARVSMWISNHNVGFYPTGNYTQLIYGAFAEYSILQTILLWGSDRFANTVQFFSFVGSAIAVSYIVKLLGGNRRAQVLAAVISVTIPEGILEASGPMNTYSASFWIATTAAFLLAWNRDASWLNTICIGLAAGLAIFTKGTTYIILPFIVLACWWIGSQQSRILFLKRSVVFLALIVAINAPQYLRNYRFDGSPLGLPLNFGEVQLTVQDIGVQSTAANILRNVSFHLGTPLDSVNSKIERGFRAAMHIIGVDPDDPRQVVWEERFLVNHMSFQELLAGNPLHFVLLLVALAIVFAKFWSGENRMVAWYSLGLTAAFVAFCAIIKWQRWSSRFQLVFFVLGAVVIALALSRYVPRRVVTAIAALLLAWGLLNATMNRYRSLIPIGRWESAYLRRATLYFAYEMDYLAPSYIAAAEAVNKTNCASVGIDPYTPLADPEIKRSPDSFFTYPIQALLHGDGRRRTVWFSGIRNLTARYAESQPHPPACAIICLSCAKAPTKWEEYRTFAEHEVFENAVVFTGATSATHQQ
jgi:hypothetical protein